MAQRSSGPGRRPRKPSRGTAQGHEGAAAAEDVQGFTHLLLPPQSFSRSMKQLLAVAAGAAIVTPAWLEACHSERIWFIVQDKHMGVDAKAENSWNFNMWSTFCNTQKYGPLLLGIPVHITPSLLRMEPRLKDLVQAAGGTLVQDLASTEEGAKQLLLGNSKEVAELKQRFKKDKAVTVLDKEAFYQAILRYSL